MPLTNRVLNPLEVLHNAIGLRASNQLGLIAELLTLEPVLVKVLVVESAAGMDRTAIAPQELLQFFVLLAGPLWPVLYGRALQFGKRAPDLAQHRAFQQIAQPPPALFISFGEY